MPPNPSPTPAPDSLDIDPSDPAAVSSPLEIKNALYARCASVPTETIFSQHDLLGLGIIPDRDIKLLLQCTQELTSEGLFKLLHRDGRACWRVVKREDAQKYKNLSNEESLVYSYIESSGREGIWSRILRSRSGLHLTVMTRCLKVLEGKNYIKQIKTAKFPNRKTYMLAGLQPSEDVTGGPFYTDGVLDDEFVHQMALWTERYIVGRSWYTTAGSTHPQSHNKKPSKHSHLSKQQAESKRNSTLESSISSRNSSHMSLLPFPPGYTGYPTIPEITRAINASNISPVMMKEVEMKQLLDILVWDGRIEENRSNEGYKAVRKAALAVMSGQRATEEGGQGIQDGQEGGSALTEAPCGRCPVMGFCEEGGPVNARSCEYFAEWLGI
ncbi:MAG: hypothetical protein L6R40_008182 [Gallowayella cf. fulva]|nr:MAG: hypothetical protein L6R40_008182 [Xanthomendoza cf. fulva]